jgi:aminopeptidase N
VPSEKLLYEQLQTVNPEHVSRARESMLNQLASALHDDWAATYQAMQHREGYRPDARQSGQRALANLALYMLVRHAGTTGDRLWPGRAYQQVKDATNMTERMGALVALVHGHAELADGALAHFHARFSDEALVIDKWFSVQATAPERDGRVFERVKALLQHPDYSARNPNRARSLVASYAMANPGAFHRSDAAGYVFWADRVTEFDSFNPQLASRIARVMERWQPLAEPWRSAAREALSRVAARSELSADVREIVSRALGGN